MAIEKINFVYPKGTLQSVFDGEAVTALELSAMTSKKVDECVDLVNGVELIATEATAVVDEMKNAQEQFLTDNSDTRAQLISDNQDFIDTLTVSKTAFETSMTSDLNTFKTATNTALNTFEDGLTASKGTIETDMTNSFNTFKSGLDAEKATFENDMNTALNTFEDGLTASKGTIETNMTNSFNTFKTGLDAEKATYTTSLNQIITDGQEAVTQIITDGQDAVNAIPADVTIEVANKILAMVNDGSLASIINTNLLSAINSKIKEIQIDVKDFGAVGNGVTDDTTAIQNAIDSLAYGTVVIQNGTYMVKGTDGTPTRDGDKGGIRCKSNVHVFIKNATVKVINTNFTDYNVFRLNGVTNVTIYGHNGIIEGDRLTNQSATGEHGFGVGLWIAKNCVIKDLTIKNFWGDSIILTNISPWTGYCENIVIDNVICDNNRRQGISVTVAKNTIIKNSKFYNIHGTAPQAGIDVEPNQVGDILEDTKIIDCHFYGNVCGINLHGGKGTIIRGNTIRNNTFGIGINNNADSIIEGNYLSDNLTQISCEVATGNTIIDNKMYGGQTGLSLSNLSTDNEVKNNTFKGNTTVGIQIVGMGGNDIQNNKISDTPKGIDLYLANDNHITGNNIKATRHISVVGDNNNIQLNRMSNTVASDIALSGTANVFSNNYHKGVTLSDGGTNTVKNNNIA